MVDTRKIVFPIYFHRRYNKEHSITVEVFSHKTLFFYSHCPYIYPAINKSLHAILIKSVPVEMTHIFFYNKKTINQCDHYFKKQHIIIFIFKFEECLRINLSNILLRDSKINQEIC